MRHSRSLRSRLVLMLLPVLAMAAAPTAHANDEKDGDTRLHDAYVLEVVDGKIAEAAKAYLGLIDDETAGARARAEARFRFAICASLLGRSDEARAHLDDLLRTEDLPEALRDRVEAYRKALSDVGLGTELDRKLQSLVFDLAKADAGVRDVTVYRDFEIISTAALPFLRKLLEHRDATLRTHAFRLLLRLDEPGVVTRWSPELASPGYGFGDDLRKYCARNEGALEAFEKRVLALGKPGIDAVSRIQPLPYSAAFLRAYAAGGGPAPHAAYLLVNWPRNDARNAVIASWLAGEDPALRDAILEDLAQFPEHPAATDAAFDQAVPNDPARYTGIALVQDNPFNAAGVFSDEPTGPAAEKVRSLVRSPESWGQFKTPSLRGVAATAPYMHEGQLPTLDAVIRHYSTLENAVLPGHHQEQLLVALHLSEREIADLVAFLEALTPDLPPEELLAPVP